MNDDTKVLTGRLKFPKNKKNKLHFKTKERKLSNCCVLDTLSSQLLPLIKK